MNLEQQADQDAALRVPCPLESCSARVGAFCRNLKSGADLEHLPAHQARLDAAGVVHAPLDSRYLRDPERSRW